MQTEKGLSLCASRQRHNFVLLTPLTLIKLFGLRLMADPLRASLETGFTWNTRLR